MGAPLCEVEPLAGVKRAPAALRAAGLEAIVRQLQWDFEDYGDVVPAADGNIGDSLPPSATNPEIYYPLPLVKSSIRLGADLARVHERVDSAAEQGNFVLTAGGDHSVATASISGIMRHRPELGVIWVNAFGNCNTPDTSPSNNYHGMPLAHLLGWFEKQVAGFEWFDERLAEHGPLLEGRVAMVGLRNLDEEERELVRRSGVHVFSMHDVDRYGIGEVMTMALERIDPKGRRPLHLSFDIDGCDPAIAPGTSMKARGGLSLREAHYICERLATTGRLGSMDIVEIDPDGDRPILESMHGDDPTIKATETVRLGLELVASALGKTIA